MSNERNHAVSIRVDNVTEDEAHKLEQKFIDDKREIAPEGRGTSLKGLSNQLPSSERKAIDEGQDD